MTQMFTVTYSDGWFHITYPMRPGIGTCYESICADSEFQEKRELMAAKAFDKHMKDAIRKMFSPELRT